MKRSFEGNSEPLPRKVPKFVDGDKTLQLERKTEDNENIDNNGEKLDETLKENQIIQNICEGDASTDTVEKDGPSKELEFNITGEFDFFFNSSEETKEDSLDISSNSGGANYNVYFQNDSFIITPYCNENHLAAQDDMACNPTMEENSNEHMKVSDLAGNKDTEQQIGESNSETVQTENLSTDSDPLFNDVINNSIVINNNNSNNSSNNNNLNNIDLNDKYHQELMNLIPNNNFNNDINNINNSQTDIISLSDEEDEVESQKENSRIIIEILSDEEDDIFEMNNEISIDFDSQSPTLSPNNNKNINDSKKSAPILIDLDNDDFDYSVQNTKHVRNEEEDDILYVETKQSPIFNLVTSIFNQYPSPQSNNHINMYRQISNYNQRYHPPRNMPTYQSAIPQINQIQNSINSFSPVNTINNNNNFNNNNNNNIYINNINNSNIISPESVVDSGFLSQLFENNTSNAIETLEGDPTLKVTLLKHQKEALFWMVNQEKNISYKGGILADDMGCGKTVSTIACMLHNKFDEPYQKNLIIVPNSCLLQWEKEIRTKTDNSILKRIYLHYGYNRTSEHQKLENTDVVLTTYGTLASEYQSDSSPLLFTNWNRVILDEAHYIKNRRTKVANATYNLQSKYRWCLTGTPIQNRLDDIHSLFVFLRFKPYNEYSYWKTWLGQSSRSVHGGLYLLRNLLRKIVLRREKKDKSLFETLNLPEKEIINERAKFSDFENTIYLKLETSSASEFRKLMETGSVMRNYGNVLALIHRLRQACNHTKLVEKEISTEKRILSAEKQTRIKEQIECAICMDVMENAAATPCGHSFCVQCIRSWLCHGSFCPYCKTPLAWKDIIPLDEALGREDPSSENGYSTKLKLLLVKIREMRENNPDNKCVVISQWTSFLNIIQKDLNDNNIAYRRIDGMMSIKQRQLNIDDFSKPEGPYVMLLSLRAAGVGLNLCMANYVFMMDLWWNPAVEYQAIDRVHRLGQTKPVKIYKFTIENTIEERILRLQEKKQRLIESTLGNDPNVDPVQRLNLEDLIDLFGMGDRYKNSLVERIHINNVINNNNNNNNNSHIPQVVNPPQIININNNNNNPTNDGRNIDSYDQIL